METRVIVADNARARIFGSDSTINALREMEDFIHSGARLSGRDIDADAAGKSRNPHGALDHASSATEHEMEVFARSLARRLKELHNDKHFEQLILIAPPKFLGLLRRELPGPLDQLVDRCIDKDLTTAKVEDIIDYIKG
jgi:protein required for attachment to host cells